MRHVKGPKLKFDRDVSTHYPCFHRYERRPSATQVRPASLRYPDSICARARQSQSYSTKNRVSCKVKVGNERSKLGEHHKRAKRAEHTSEQNTLSANERAR